MPAFLSSRSQNARSSSPGGWLPFLAARLPWAGCADPAAHWPVGGRLMRLSGRTAAGLAVTVTLAAAAPPPAHPAAPTTLARVAGAIFRHGEFNAVTSVSTADAWAVGALSTQQHPVLGFVARWNGTSWARVPSPGPGKHNDNDLTGVSAVSASDAWAVGWAGTFGLSTVVLHWNGTRWARVHSPNPGFPASSNTLSAVSAASASSAWAVGTYGNTEQTLVLHWNGATWAQQPTPNPGGREGSQLLGVASVPGSGAWAVGCYGSRKTGQQRTLALHWNGTSWTQVPTPGPGVTSCLNAVTAISPANAWAVGWAASRYHGPGQTVVLHWNGTRWTRVASPSPRTGSSELNAVSVITVADAWAVGNVTRHQVSTTIVLRWDGTGWTRVASPNRGSSALSGVSGVSAHAALAVGYGGAGTLALRWNGSRWVVI